MSNNLQVVFDEDIENLIPRSILFNYDQLKEQMTARLERYKGRIYTEDQIDEAKKDRALLNKFAKDLDNIRLGLKKEYNKPFTVFEGQIKDLVGLVGDVAADIDAVVKKHEAEQAEAKKDEIEEYFNSVIGKYAEFIPFDKIFDEKWLNRTTKMSAIKEAIDQIITNVNDAMTAIKTLGSTDENYLISFYFRTLDLGAAIQESARLQKEKERVEAFNNTTAPKEENAPITPLTLQNDEMVIRFEVRGTKAQMMALRDYLKKNNIAYKAI